MSDENGDSGYLDGVDGVTRRQLLLAAAAVAGGALGVVTVSDSAPQNSDGNEIGGKPQEPDTDSTETGFGAGEYGRGGFGE